MDRNKVVCLRTLGMILCVLLSVCFCRTWESRAVEESMDMPVTSVEEETVPIEKASAESQALEWLEKAAGDEYEDAISEFHKKCEIARIFNIYDVLRPEELNRYFGQIEKVANTDWMARYFGATGDNAAFHTLFSMQNPDGGFGLDENYVSEAYDSYLVAINCASVNTNLVDTNSIETERLKQYFAETLDLSEEEMVKGQKIDILRFLLDRAGKGPEKKKLLAKYETLYQEAVDHSGEKLNSSNFEFVLKSWMLLAQNNKLAHMEDKIELLEKRQREDGSFDGSVEHTCLALECLKTVKEAVKRKLGIDECRLIPGTEVLYAGNDGKVDVRLCLSYSAIMDTAITIQTEITCDGTKVDEKENTYTLSGNQTEDETRLFIYDFDTSQTCIYHIDSVIYDEEGRKLGSDSQKLRVIPKGEGIDICLIETVLPWNCSSNTRLLNQLELPFDKVSVSKAGEMDLSSYQLIIIANDQDSGSYNQLAKMDAKFTEYVRQGGVLLYGNCSEGHVGGKSYVKLPGGVEMRHQNVTQNEVVDQEHPVVCGGFSDGIKLQSSDLRGSYASHNYLVKDTLPDGANVIIADANHHPTLAEYPLGDGLVIGSGMTWEFYFQMNGALYSKKAMDDLFLYAYRQAEERQKECIQTELTLDGEEYEAEQDVTIHVQAEVLNQAGEITGTVSICDEQGVMVETLDDAVKLEQSWDQSYVWNTGERMSGTYKACVVWENRNGETCRTERAFRIRPDGDLKNELSVTPSSPKRGEEIFIRDIIRNTSTNSVKNGLVERIRIENADGKTVAQFSTELDQFRAKGKQIQERSLETDEFPAGTYTVTAEIWEEGELLSSHAAEFLVTEEVKPKDIDFSLYSTDGDIQIGCCQATVQKSIYARQNLMFNGSILNAASRVMAGGNVQAYGWIIDMKEKLENMEAPLIPDVEQFFVEPVKNYAKEKELFLFSECVKYKDDVYCQNTSSMYTNLVEMDGSLVSEQDISINAGQVRIGEDSEKQRILCSRKGNITINTTDLSVNGIIYAPEGTVTIQTCNTKIKGTIIAKRIQLQGSYFTFE